MDTIETKYQKLGGAAGFLGQPLGVEKACPDKQGRFCIYQGGAIYWHPQIGAHEVHGVIRAKWEALGNEHGVMGYPRSDEIAAADGKGRYSLFQGGAIVWHPARRAYEVHGPAWGKWQCLGAERGFLGYPLMGEGTCPPGMGTSEQHPGHFQHFEHGSIYWHPMIAAHEVHGAIREKWKSLGWEQGELGYPKSDEMKSADGRGRFNLFQTGAVVWHPARGAFEVQGLIWDKWSALGAETGWLGYPLMGKGVCPDGKGAGPQHKGYFQHFENGSIYLHPLIGAHEVHGAIREKWKSLGWEQGCLGYPKSDEMAAADGQGRFSEFQGGSIYWHPDIGTFEVIGEIWEKWKQFGKEAGFLGYPLMGEGACPDGVGRFQHFQGGSIYQHPQAGCHEVHGDIRRLWSEVGWEQSSLGYPTTDEMASADGIGRFNNFQIGSIYYSPDKGSRLMDGPSPRRHKYRLENFSIGEFIGQKKDTKTYLPILDTRGLGIPEYPHEADEMLVGYHHVDHSSWPNKALYGVFFRAVVAYPEIANLHGTVEYAEMILENRVVNHGIGESNDNSRIYTAIGSMWIADAPYANYQTPVHPYYYFPVGSLNTENTGNPFTVKYEPDGGYYLIEVTPAIAAWVASDGDKTCQFLFVGRNEDLEENNDYWVQITKVYPLFVTMIETD